MYILNNRGEGGRRGSQKGRKEERKKKSSLVNGRAVKNGSG